MNEGEILQDLARSLRRNQTEAEKKIWNRIRSKQIQGVKFRRQQSFGPYILDFCPLEEKLVIEIDGGHHSRNQEADTKRTKFLEKEGFRVIRIWNDEVFKNIDGVMEHILNQIAKLPSPRPSPLQGEGGKS